MNSFRKITQECVKKCIYKPGTSLGNSKQYGIAGARRSCSSQTSEVVKTPHQMREQKELERLARIKKWRELLKEPVDDGLPTYLKRGATDRLLFGFACVYVAGGLIYGFSNMYKIIYPNN